MPVFRLALLVAVALALGPGTWVRTPYRPRGGDDLQRLEVTALPLPSRRLGNFTVAGAWQLQSGNRHFGSYSALLVLNSGRLFAVSDGSRRLELTPPDVGPPRPRFGYLTTVPRYDKEIADSESITFDRNTGRMWAGYELGNSIERINARHEPDGHVRPAAMRGWSHNDGPEAMVRLADGRFIVLAESDPSWLASDSPALLFRQDPVGGSLPVQFRFDPPSGFSPVDMAQLPDGRVLILVRRLKWQLPQSFAAKLVLADPARIRKGETWRGEVVAELDGSVPMDNYEGLAVGPGPHGKLAVWLISDDNFALFQRTILLKLEWDLSARVKEKSARNGPRASSAPVGAR